MAVTSIWPINGRVSVLINYAANPEKTREKVSAGLHQIDGVIQYAADELKTEKRELVTCINCSGGVETALPGIYSFRPRTDGGRPHA